MTYYNGISQSRKAPKIDRASHDRSELLLTHETTPSPQHYYQNREFEKDAFKAPSPIFGYQRNSLKKKVIQITSHNIDHISRYGRIA